MKRLDLLALSDDDLAALTNRGTVKRAQREIDESILTCLIETPAVMDLDQSLVVNWSDGTQCKFPPGRTIHEATCSSGSLGISRHVIRSVLAYQRFIGAADPLEDSAGQNATSDSEAGSDLTRTKLAAWNPGDISDEELVKQFRKASITKARTVFEQGVLVELTRGTKPTARFLHESCTVRFPVPNDIRYVRGDCAESMLPQWAAMAVWAFRKLPADRMAGMLSLGITDLPVPSEELDRLGELLCELCSDGLAGLGATWPQRMARLEQQLRDCGLIWPAELVVDLLHQLERYQQHDARFSPQELVRLTGELIARERAIRSPNGSVPQALVRGNRSDRRTDIKAGRFVGIGLGVQPGRQQTKLHAYFQDVDTGTVVAVQRIFADPESSTVESLKSYTELATHSLSRGVSIGGAALSQILIGAGKRTPTDELVLPRGAGKLTANPQTFQWEQLAPPLAIESFKQARERFDTLPPAWLRPRRHTENLHVLPITGITDVVFDVVNQQMTATLHDADQETANLVFPYHRRGDQGFNELLTTLKTRSTEARFVCGHVRLVHQRVEIQPIVIVFVSDNQSRQAVAAWVSGNPVTAGEQAIAPKLMEKTPSSITEFSDALRAELGNALVMGLRQADQRSWNELSEAAQRIGFVRLAVAISALATELSERAKQLRWSAASSARILCQLCMLARVLE